MKISEIRKEYPQYESLSDRELADALHNKFYPNMDLGDFYERVGLTKTGIGAAASKGIESLISSAVPHSVRLLAPQKKPLKQGLSAAKTSAHATLTK